MFNKKKPILKPNFSFDLTRLACSLYDYFVPYSDEEHKVTHKIGKLIIKWCKDDRGKNILYKQNGDERYPDFKLYKMIARTVHKHLPEEEIKNHMFDEFKVTKKTLKKRIPLVMEFQPDLMPKNRIKKSNNLFKNYKYFYNLSDTGKNKQKLNIETIKKLYKEIEKNKGFTDLLLI